MSWDYREDPYKALGVSKDADEKAIKRAFRALARECHPDVAGESPEAVAKFRRIRAAYELLIEPKSRRRYDRRAAGWGPGQGFGGRRPGKGTPPPAHAPGEGNDIDLEDIFGDHGGFADFGFGSAGSGSASAGGAGRRSSGAPSSAVGRHRPGASSQRKDEPGGARRQGRSSRGQEPGPGARIPGEDVHIDVEIPAAIARDGGLCEVNYARRRPAVLGGALGGAMCQEVYDLRVPPGVRAGQVLTVEKMGHAGSGGGWPGDLHCNVIGIIPEEPAGPAPGSSRRRSGRGRAEGSRAQPARLAISIQECLLGASVAVGTPSGEVRVTLPACTAGGSLLRLRGKGEAGGDWFVRVVVVPPAELDDESCQLIEAFAARNPYDPRS